MYEQSESMANIETYVI